MYFKFFVFLELTFFQLKTKSIYRILGKFVYIFLMVIEMSVRDDVAVRLLDKSCKYM